jgi:hypothetical protein
MCRQYDDYESKSSERFGPRWQPARKVKRCLSRHSRLQMQCLKMPWCTCTFVVVSHCAEEPLKPSKSLLRSVLDRFSSSCRVSETSESAQERPSQCLCEGLLEGFGNLSDEVIRSPNKASFCVISTAWDSNASWPNDAWTVLPRAEILNC